MIARVRIGRVKLKRPSRDNVGVAGSYKEVLVRENGCQYPATFISAVWITRYDFSDMRTYEYGYLRVA